MYITELSEPQLLVIYPGRFQPFHKGHHAVYNYLTTKYGRNNVYIATSNKVEPPKSPFSFAEKAYFMQLTGVPSDRIIQATSPYQIETVITGGNLSIADPANTVVIFAVSEKDMAEDPRFKSFTKKDGTPAYLQKMPGNMKETEGMNRHAYIMTVPTFDFDVLGQPMRSGTELRAQYVAADEKTRQAIIKDLFGKYTVEAEKLMTDKLAPAAPIEAPRPVKLPKTVKAAGLNEVRIIDPAFVDLYYEPMNRNSKTKLVAQHVPKDQLDRIINTLVQKRMAHENRFSWKPSEGEERYGRVAEMGGVGVVRGGNDPRYVMATAGDQNDVTGDTLGKEMKALGLTGRKPTKTGQQPIKGGIGRGLK